MVDSIEFPCIVCMDNCIEDQEAVCCNMCKNWTHLKCINLSRKKFDLLSKSSLPGNSSIKIWLPFSVIAKKYELDKLISHFSYE